MKNNKIKLLLLIITIITTNISSKTILKEYRDKYCSGIKIKELEHSPREYEEMRETRKNHFHSDYIILIKFLHGEDTSDIIEATLPYFILLIIFLGFVFIFFLVTVLLLFSCFKKCLKKRSIWKILFIILFILTFLAFVIFCVYIVLMMKSLDQGMCIFYRTIQNLLEGNSELGDESFLGFFTLEKMNNQFTKEADNLALNNDSNALIMKNVSPNNISQMFLELNQFQKKFENRKTSNPIKKTNPYSIQNLTKTINPQIGYEFQALYQTAYSLHQSAEKSFMFGNIYYKMLATEVINGTSMGLNYINGRLRETFIDNIDKDYLFMDYLKYGNIILIIFITILFVILIFFLITVLKAHCVKRIIRKIILVIGMLFLMGGIIACIYVLFGTASFSGFCEYAAKMNRGEIDILDHVEANDSIRLLTLTCFLNTSQGQVFEAILQDDIPINIFNHYRYIINGVKDFELYEEKNKKNYNSFFIDKQIKQWEKVQNGFEQDHKNINKTLEELNNLIECSDQKFEISKVKCFSQENCLSILDTENFKSPKCSSNKNLVNKHFKNLKNYSEETNKLITDLKTEIGTDSEVEKLNGKFKNLKSNLLSEKKNVKKIKKNLKKTFSYIDNYKSNFNVISDCRILRKELLRLEHAACFEFKHYLYIFMITSIVLLILAFFLFIVYFFFYLQKRDGLDQSEGNNHKGMDRVSHGNVEENVRIVNETDHVEENQIYG